MALWTRRSPPRAPRGAEGSGAGKLAHFSSIRAANRRRILVQWANLAAAAYLLYLIFYSSFNPTGNVEKAPKEPVETLGGAAGRSSRFAYVSIAPTDALLPGVVTLFQSLRDTGAGHDLVLLTNRRTSVAAAELLCGMGVRILQLPLHKAAAELRPWLNPSDHTYFYGGLPSADALPGAGGSALWTIHQLMQLWVHALFSLGYERLVYVDPTVLVLDNLDDLFVLALPPLAPFASVNATVSGNTVESALLVLEPTRARWLALAQLMGILGPDNAGCESIGALLGRWRAALGSDAVSTLPRHTLIDHLTFALEQESASVPSSVQARAVRFSHSLWPWLPFQERLWVNVRPNSTLAARPLDSEPFQMQWRRTHRQYLLWRTRRPAQCARVASHVAPLPTPRLDAIIGQNLHCLDLWADEQYPATCYEIYPFFGGDPTGNAQQPLGHGLSIATQLSANKVDRLVAMANEWTGPISAALYFEGSLEDARALVSRLDIPRDRVSVHLVRLASVGNVPASAQTPRPYYPINFMRNVALQYVQTSLLLVLDVDFVLSPPDLFTLLTGDSALATTLRRLATPANKHAFVVPAFQLGNVSLCATEVARYSGHGNVADSDNCTIFPRSRDALLPLYETRAAAAFHYRFVRAHRPTNYPMWLRNATERPYYAQWADYYEPYLIVHRHALSPAPAGMPWFDERFVNRGRNKICFTTLLHLAGFRLVVLPRAFVAHVWEPRDVPDEAGDEPEPERDAADPFGYTDFMRDYQLHYLDFKNTYKRFYGCWGRQSCAPSATFVRKLSPKAASGAGVSTSLIPTLTIAPPPTAAAQPT